MEALLELVRENHGVWTLIVLFFAAALEYMVPPLPADTVVLAGSLLVLAGAWPLAVVYAVAVAGGVLGSFIHYEIGRLLTRGGSQAGTRFIERLTGKGSLERFFALFRRWGVWVIAVNRMFPGIRSVTFIAAGAARLPLAPTMLLGLFSNLMWTAALLFLGISLGGNWEKIEHAFSVYSRGLTIASTVLVAAIVIFRWVRRRRRARLESGKTHGDV